MGNVLYMNIEACSAIHDSLRVQNVSPRAYEFEIESIWVYFCCLRRACASLWVYVSILQFLALLHCCIPAGQQITAAAKTGRRATEFISQGCWTSLCCSNGFVNDISLLFGICSSILPMSLQKVLKRIPSWNFPAGLDAGSPARNGSCTVPKTCLHTNKKHIKWLHFMSCQILGTEIQSNGPAEYWALLTNN